MLHGKYWHNQDGDFTHNFKEKLTKEDYASVQERAATVSGSFVQKMKML